MVIWGPEIPVSLPYWRRPKWWWRPWKWPLEAEARAAKKTTESFENCIVVVGYSLILGYQIRFRYLEIRDAGRVEERRQAEINSAKVPEIPRRSDLGWFNERKCLRETKRVFKELKSLWWARKQKGKESWGTGIEKSQGDCAVSRQEGRPLVPQFQRVASRNRLVCPSVRYPTIPGHSYPCFDLGSSRR